MGQRTCSVSECTRPHRGRGFCNMHYQRWKKHGDPEKVKQIRDGCEIDGCDRKHFGHGYCQYHHYRWSTTGDPLRLPSGQAPRGTFTECAIDDCKRPPRGGWGYCTTHGGNYRATGDPLTTPGPSVKSRPCVRCGAVIDFTVADERGRRYSPAMRICRGCRREPGQTKHIPYLIDRDGNACGLCGEIVDTSIKYPDPRSASVDHVIPRVHGGADRVQNYQLAHLGCNVRKHTRIA